MGDSGNVGKNGCHFQIVNKEGEFLLLIVVHGLVWLLLPFLNGVFHFFPVLLVEFAVDGLLAFYVRNVELLQVFESFHYLTDMDQVEISRTQIQRL